jgi:ribosomal protein L40E
MTMNPKEPVRCPKCASTDVRYSYTQTTWDLIMDLLFSMDAFRCRSCRHRFHKFDPGGGEGDQQEAKKSE